MQRSLKHAINWQLFETGASFNFRDFEVRSFAVPHDAQDPVGFLISHGHDDLISPRRRLAWLTDLGHAPLNVREHIREADVLVVEAITARTCCRPTPSARGAPSSASAAATATCQTPRHGNCSKASPARAGATCFLTHLSRDCNSPAAVEAACGAVLAARGCGLSVVAAGGGTPLYEF
ncbi:MAG: MBL fold metallo-hydrolase [Lacunisphaera sp.]